MITGVHALIYSDDAEATRRFLADVVGLDHVDDGGGWLIFSLPPAELGVHPTQSHEPGGDPSPRHHSLSLLCDDLPATLLDLESRGARVLSPAQEEDWGVMAVVEVPGADPLMIYEPRHQTAIDQP